MESTLEITPQEFQARVTGGDAITLIDVREPEEHLMAHIEGAELIPMQSVPAQLQKLEGLADEKDLAIFCHHGVRSLNVVLWLRQRGLENCFSIAGGIDRWSCEIDPSVPRY
jgi:rhodanese-related sulfurtransferase